MLDRWADPRRHNRTRTIVVSTTIGVSILPEAGSEPEALVERPVEQLTLSPDGSAIAYVDAERGVVEVIDVRTRSTATDPIAVPAIVHGVRWSDVGLVVASDEWIALAPLDGGPAETLIDAPTGATLGAPDVGASGRSLVVPVTEGGTTSVSVRAPSAERDRALPESSGRVLSVAMSPDGSRHAVATSHADDPFANEISVVDTSDGSTAAVIPLGPDAHPDTSWGFIGPDHLLVESAEGLEVRTVGGDGATDHEIALETEERLPNLVEFVAAAQHLVTRHQDGTLRLWTDEGALVDVLATGAANTVDLQMSVDGLRVTAVAGDDTIRIWRASDGTLVERIDTFAAGRINAVATHGSGTIAAASTGGVIRVVDAITDGETQFATDGRNVDTVGISPDGGTVAAGVGERVGESAFDDTVVLWQRSDSSERYRIGGEGEAVPGCDFFRNRVVFSPDGMLLATSSHDFVISIWNVADGSLNHRLPAHPGSIHDLTFSSDGSLLASSSEAADLRIWNLDRREIDGLHDTAPGGYRAVEFLPDDSTLAASDITGAISLVTVNDGSIGAVLDGTMHRDGDLAVSPDGGRVAAGDDDGNVIVWSLATGEAIARLDGHRAPVRAVEFMADGRSVVTGSDDATIRLWDLAGE